MISFLNRRVLRSRVLPPRICPFLFESTTDRFPIVTHALTQNATGLHRFGWLNRRATNPAPYSHAVQEAVQSDTPGTARKHASNLDQVFDVITRGAGTEITWQMASVLRTRVTYLRTITSRVASSERRVESIHLLEDIRKALLARDGDLETAGSVQLSGLYRMPLPTSRLCFAVTSFEKRCKELS